MRNKKPCWEIIVDAMQHNKTVQIKVGSKWYDVPRYGQVSLNDVSRHAKNYRIKKPIKYYLDEPSLRTDAKPGETERQYRKRGAPLRRENRKAERAAEKMRSEALKKIR